MTSESDRLTRDDAARRLAQMARLREVESEILSRWPESKIVPTLSRIQATMELLGDPQHSFPVVHLTGTNGKTSTTRFVERLLREHGLRTGRFVSPHLHDMRERIALDGEMVDPQRFIDAYDEVIAYIRMVDERTVADGGPEMTYFEVFVALAYALFADAPVDVGVIEVGLGGAWDATNVVNAAVSVICPIALDHTRLLGDTIHAIATEKAGIIKPGGIVVVAHQVPEAREVIMARAEEVGARVVEEGVDFEVLAREVAVGGQLLQLRGLAGEYRDVFIPLFGEHQAQNAVLALAATEAFLGGGEQPLDGDVVRTGFGDADSPGRLEVVRTSPMVMVDGAHNPAAARALRDALQESFTISSLVGVIAMFADKEVEQVLEILEPVLDEVVVSRNTSHRAMPVAELAVLARDIFGDHRVTEAPDLAAAIDVATGIADRDGMTGAVLATGSLHTAGEVRLLLKGDCA